MTVSDGLPSADNLAGHWLLSKDIVFLNHGSFGACPAKAVEYREKLLRQAELDPMDFLLNSHQPMLELCLARLEQFTNAPQDSIVMVENATTAVNTVLRNLPVKPGETVLVTDQEYFSSANALETIAHQRGFTIKKVELPFPVPSENAVVEKFSDAIEPSVRFALLDHIVSSTGMVLPLKRIIRLFQQEGIETVVDGAHGPGQVPLNLTELGCLAYTGNCHKWLCSPRSAALLYVRPDFQQEFKPLVVSHLPREFSGSISDFQIYFRWNGTPDPTPELAVPFTMDLMESFHTEGWKGIMRSNRTKVLNGWKHLCRKLEVDPPCPDSMVGSMASVPLEGCCSSGPVDLHWTDPLQDRLKREFSIIAPVTSICNGRNRLLRISAQLYNSCEQYTYLADSLLDIFRRS